MVTFGLSPLLLTAPFRRRHFAVFSYSATPRLRYAVDVAIAATLIRAAV